MRSYSRRNVLAFGAIVGTAWLGSTPARADDTVAIGFAGPMTGPVAAFGNDIKRGIDLAIAAVNAKGGVRGKKLAVVVRDDEFDPVKTVGAYRDLIERQNVVALVGTANSAAMLAVTPLLNDQYKIPAICVHTDATAIIHNQAEKEGRDNYLFRLGMFGSGQADFLVDSIVKKFGLAKVGLLTWTAGYGQIGRIRLVMGHSRAGAMESRGRFRRRHDRQQRRDGRWAAIAGTAGGDRRLLQGLQLSP
jgi:branched-chain amino acid transport system substrate-binding protein